LHRLQIGSANAIVDPARAVNRQNAPPSSFETAHPA
jgi:hypothetical protein